MNRTLTIGTRKSKMALWQTDFVKQQLELNYPGLVVLVRHVVTLGDRTQESNQPMPEIGGKGLFTAELESALRDRTIDLAVHALKDLPTKFEPEFALGAVCERGEPWDILISRTGQSLDELPAGTIIGTSSVRRSSQILHRRPDLIPEHIRGNADTRVAKLFNPSLPYGAILLAHAGLERLGMLARVTQVLGMEEMVPAPGQGAVAVQCRSDDAELLSMLASIAHGPTTLEVTAERTFLGSLGAGCNTPVAALARYIPEHTLGAGAEIHLRARCLSPDGRQKIELESRGRAIDAAKIGEELAKNALQQGFLTLSVDQPTKSVVNGHD